MKKSLACKRHKYISKKIKRVTGGTTLPVECEICGKVYFSEKPFRFQTASGRAINICLSCKKKIKCASCGKNFNMKKFYLGECAKCGHADFFCERCGRKTIILPTAAESKKSALCKLRTVLKEFIHDLDNLPKNIKDLKRMKGFDKMPSYLLLHFNIILPGGFGSFDEGDEADWWKK